MSIKGAEATVCAVFLARTGCSKQEIRDYITTEFGYDLTRTVDEISPDSARTSAHDVLISAVNMIARYQKEEGGKWRDLLGNDRKRIGDFGCYMALFQGLKHR